MRVKGHGLLREGRLWSEEERTFVATGPAICSCGWQSEPVTGDNARKRAHRAHKVDVVYGEGSHELG